MRSITARSILVLVTLLLLSFSQGRAAKMTGERWIRVDTPHFVILGNATPEVIRAIGSNMESLHAVLGQLSSKLRVDSPLPTYVYVFRNARSFAAYSPKKRAAGIKGYFAERFDANYVAIDASAGIGAHDVVYHEYLHYFLHNNVPNIPMWFDEGLAEFYSTFQTYDNHIDVGHPIDRHIEWLRQGVWIPVDELIAIDRLQLKGAHRVGMFYAESWALAHYLIAADQKRRRHLGEFFDVLTSGEDVQEVLQETCKMNLVELNDALRRYGRLDQYAYYRVVFPDGLPGDDSETPVRVLTDQDVAYHLADLVFQVGLQQYPKTAKRLELEVAANDSHARLWAAWADLKENEGDMGAAKESFEKAVALDSSDFTILNRYGWFLLRIIADNSSSRAVESADAQAEHARNLFESALELQPTNALALSGLGKAIILGSRVDVQAAKEALVALKAAWGQLPSRIDLLQNVITLQAYLGAHLEARALLESSLRNRAPDPDMVERAELAVVRAEMRQAESLRANGDHEAAIRLLGDSKGTTFGKNAKAMIDGALSEMMGQ